MDDDAPVLLGRLDIKLKDQHNSTTTSSTSSSCSGYVPPLALFPELVTSSSAALLIAQQQQQQANSQSSGKSSSNKKSQQQQQPYVLPGTPVIASEGSTSSSSAITSSTSRINRNRSSWDVAALTAFRDGVNVPQQQQQQQGTIASKASSSSARDAIAALLQSGRLPGTSSSVQQQSQSQSQQQLPSTTDIVKALDRFASNLGVTNEQEAAALRSLHFLHLLGYQRLQQLDGNLKMLLLSGGTESDNNNNKKPISSTTTSEKLLHQPFKMFEGEQQQEGNKNKNTNKNDPSTSWVQSRSKLYDAVLELTTSKDNNEKNNNKAFWVPPQAPAKTSTEVQTSTEIEQQETGAINWYHPENKRDSVQATSIKANEKVPCRFSLSSSSSASSSLKQETGYSLVVSLKKVVDRERLVAVNNGGDNGGEQLQQQQWEPVQVDENEHIKIPLRSHRVVVGRSVSAGTIRERESTNNNNIDVDDDDASSIDPWHIDLSSIVRKLTKNLDHGLYISKQHFVLMLSSNDNSITILPCSRNMIRVNGSVVFAAPKTVSLLESTSSSDVVITIGSGNTSPAGVVIQVKIVKEELSN